MTGIDQGRTLLFSITEHCFPKNKLKRSTFLLKSLANLLSWIISEMQGIFPSFYIVFRNDQQNFGVMTLKHSFLMYFRSTCFCSSPVVHTSSFVASLASCQRVTFLIQIKLISFVFFLNHCFHFVIYPRRLPIVKSFGFMGNKWYLLIYTLY